MYDSVLSSCIYAYIHIEVTSYESGGNEYESGGNKNESRGNESRVVRQTNTSRKKAQNIQFSRVLFETFVALYALLILFDSEIETVTEASL